MDIKKKPFAELYLDALCDNLKASMEIHRRVPKKEPCFAANSV